MPDREQTKSDGTGLCTHDAQKNEVPGHGAVAQEISFQIFAGAAFVQTIRQNEQQGSAQYYPVDLTHAKILVSQEKDDLSNQYQQQQYIPGGKTTHGRSLMGNGC